jgi:hypothetical protein
MNDARAIFLIEPREDRHGRMEREETIEGKCRVLTNRRQSDGAMQTRVVRVSDRSHRRQPVKRAAQDNDHEARIAAAGGAGGLREKGEGARRPGRGEQRAA